MDITDLSEKGINTVIERIVANCHDYLKINNELTGPMQTDEDFEESFEFFAVLRRIKHDLSEPLNRTERCNRLTKYTAWLNIMDEEGQFDYGWRNQFGLEIFS